MKTIVTNPSRNPLLILWIVLFAITLIVYAALHPPIKFIVLNLAPLAAAFCLMASISGFGYLPVTMWMKDKNVAIKVLSSLALGIMHIPVDKIAYNTENEKRLYSWSKEDQNRFVDFLLHHCDDIGRSREFILYRAK